MKFSIIRKITIFLFPALLLSCGGLSVNHSVSQSWLIRENKIKAAKPTLTLLSVQVDMTGGRDSIEKEVAYLAPLYFWNRGCRIIPAADTPDYAAKINIREREIRRGLKIKRSLSVEVIIWPFENAPDVNTPIYERNLPAAVGRVICIGEKSFSSSEITGKTLSRTIGIAARKLTAHKRQK
jgi:hypothetical protein